ncbi:MAG: hypothetical protein WDW38_000550 [Sanguina aurantia]
MQRLLRLCRHPRTSLELPCTRPSSRARRLVTGCSTSSSSSSSSSLLSMVPPQERLKNVFNLPSRWHFRDKDEPLEKTFARLRKNLEKATGKPQKTKKRGAAEASAASNGSSLAQAKAVTEVQITLFYDASCTRPIPDSETNGEAWCKCEALLVGEDTYDVLYNPPDCAQAELFWSDLLPSVCVRPQLAVMKRALVGHPLMGRCTTAFSQADACQYRWSRRKAGSITPEAPAAATPKAASHGLNRSSSTSVTGDERWTDVSSEEVYTPTPEDEGYVLRLEVTPGVMHQRSQAGAGSSSVDSHAAADSAGVAAVASTARVVPGSVEHVLWLGEPMSMETGIVAARPFPTSASMRAGHVSGPTVSPSLRILSYNILADQYAGSVYAQDVLFSYCPKLNLEPDYRKQLVREELESYHADIMCVQEVDAERAYEAYLAPLMRRAGYDSHYTNKMGKVREGSATFWRAARFRKLAGRDIRLRDIFVNGHSLFQPLLSASPRARTGPPEKGCLCVINTHLFFHPYAPHIRTLHTAAILHEAALLLQEAASSMGPEVAALLLSQPPSIVFCGDLNSDLNDGVPGAIALLQNGGVSSGHWDWIQGAPFRWGMQEEDGEAVAEAAASLCTPAATSAPATSSAEGMDVDVTVTTAAAAVAAVAEATGKVYPLPLVTGLDLTNPFKLRSADDLKTPYTNYTSGYKALLDYVWYEPARLEVLSTVPMPSEEVLAGFIPSPVFPSDHLAVVYDLKWKPLAAQTSSE